jgi:hypothetical protein
MTSVEATVAEEIANAKGSGKGMASVQVTKETFYMTKETFYMTKETNIHARGTHSQGCGQMKKKIKQIFVRGRHILKHEANEYIHALEDTYSDVVKYIYLHISSYVHVCIYIHAWETRTHT